MVCGTDGANNGCLLFIVRESLACKISCPALGDLNNDRGLDVSKDYIRPRRGTGLRLKGRTLRPQVQRSLLKTKSRSIRDLACSR